MLSMQGLICKDLKKQDKLPEKWNDLIMDPVKQPITREEGLIPIMTSNTHELGTLTVTRGAVEAVENAWHAFNPYYYEGYKIKATHSADPHTKVVYTPKTPIPKGKKFKLRIYCTPEMLAHKTASNAGKKYYPSTGCWLMTSTNGSGGGSGCSILHRDMSVAGQFYYKEFTTSEVIRSIVFNTHNDYGTGTWYNYLIMPNLIPV